MAEAPDFQIKRGDTSPAIEAVLEDSEGAAVNLTATTVRFKMRGLGANEETIDASAEVVDAAEGQVRYQWLAADTDTEGRYDAEFEVTYTASGSVETFPNHRHLKVWIRADLD